MLIYNPLKYNVFIIVLLTINVRYGKPPTRFFVCVGCSLAPPLISKIHVNIIIYIILSERITIRIRGINGQDIVIAIGVVSTTYKIGAGSRE